MSGLALLTCCVRVLYALVLAGFLLYGLVSSSVMCNSVARVVVVVVVAPVAFSLPGVGGWVIGGVSFWRCWGWLPYHPRCLCLVVCCLTASLLCCFSRCTLPHLRPQRHGNDDEFRDFRFDVMMLRANYGREESGFRQKSRAFFLFFFFLFFFCCSLFSRVRVRGRYVTLCMTDCLVTMPTALCTAVLTVSVS